jgi:hypothetical protein
MLLRDIDSPELLLLAIHRAETIWLIVCPWEQWSRSLTFANEDGSVLNGLVGFGSGWRVEIGAVGELEAIFLKHLDKYPSRLASVAEGPLRNPKIRKFRKVWGKTIWNPGARR